MTMTPLCDAIILFGLLDALDAVCVMDPDDADAVAAVAERLGDAAEAAGLPRDHFLRWF